MNVKMNALILVTSMPIVPILMDHIFATVLKDFLEMERSVKVCYYYFVVHVPLQNIRLSYTSFYNHFLVSVKKYQYKNEKI